MNSNWRFAALTLVLTFASAAFAGAKELSLEPDKMIRSDLTKAERARVKTAIAAPTDFSKPQPFEAMSGGAATPSLTLPATRFQDFPLTSPWNNS